MPIFGKSIITNIIIAMKKSLILLSAIFMVANLGFAQNTEIKEDFVPSELNQPGQQYPMVNSQGYARFRIEAPDAQSVRVSLGLGGKGGTVLAKGEDGAWWGTTSGPMDEGFHYYHIFIDGGTFNDPGTENFYGSTRQESGIEIPAHDRAFYEERNIPHGNVQQVLFWSKSTNMLKKAFVYTPPTYGRDNKRYPVLYLQHFIIVMTYGMTNEGFRPGAMPAGPRPAAGAAPGGQRPQGAPAAAPGQRPAGAPAAAPGGQRPAGPGAPAGGQQRRAGGMGMMMNNGFETVLVEELIPYIDANFNTIADKDHRAMAGLSMGGMETHSITLARPEVFGYYGLLSGGTYSPEEVANTGVKFVFMGCGSKENPDGVTKAANDLKAAGYNAMSYVSEGTAHEFLTWRRCLYQMAQKLFK